MKNIYLFLFLILIYFPSQGQLIFQKIFTAPGNQNAIASMQSASDDFYILSETDSGQNNSKDFLLLKLDVSGNLLWSKYFGTTADDIPTDVKEMSNGKIMLCGYTFLNGVNNTDILLINIDTSGTVIWSKTFGGAQNDYGFKMASAIDSSVVVAGQTLSYGVNISSGYALKINSVGNIVWSLTNSSPTILNACFKSIDNTFDGNFILTGFWQSPGYYLTPLIKVDVFGNVVAACQISGPTNYFGYDIKSIPGGDFIIVGKEVTSTSDTGSVLVMRANPLTLSITFVKNFHTANFETANSVVVTPDANFAYSGKQASNNGFNITEKGFLTKLNLSGNALFSKDYQPSGYNNSINSIIVTHDNNLLMTGKISPSIGFYTSIYLIKVQLSTGLSGCDDSNFVYSSSSLINGLTLSSNNNFGGVSSSVIVSDSLANVLQNDLCTTVGLQELNFNNEVGSVYPNPSNGNFNIHFDNNLSEKTIQIFNVTGNIVYKKNKIKCSEVEFNLTTQPKGIYFLKVFDQNKISESKIVLQ